MPDFPPPPPQPPPASLSVFQPEDKIKRRLDKSGETEKRELEDEECLKQICDLTELRIPTSCEGVTMVVIMPLNTVILQNGPMCGIVALFEALLLMNQADSQVSPKTILDVAREKGLTKQGEMFSVMGMKFLAEQFGAWHHSEIIDLEEGGGVLENYSKVIANLLEGFPVLFPYDADYNHSPALRKGHAAHWAVVHGVVCQIPESKVSPFREQSSYFKILQSTPHLLVVQPIRQSNCSTPSSTVISKLVELFKYETSFAIAHQGKSYRTALWPFLDLFESNQNLKETSQSITDNHDQFLCDDIISGLCSKVLLLKM